jgi:hypothetical protein
LRAILGLFSGYFRPCSIHLEELGLMPQSYTVEEGEDFADTDPTREILRRDGVKMGLKWG